MFNYFKLQICCLLIIEFFVFLYLRDSNSNKTPCNKFFDALMIVSPLAVFFDGLTAWSVNCLEFIPLWMNLLFHCLFYIFINLSIVIAFFYMLSETIGISKKPLIRSLILLPSIISFAVIILFIKQVYFVHGNTTNYSMGISVIACFVSILVHFLLTLGLLLFKRRSLNSKKYHTFLIVQSVAFVLLVVQIVFPELLISSVFQALLLIGIYVSGEDPAKRRIEQYVNEIIMGFATIEEGKDPNTGGHIKRTKGYVKIILDEMNRCVRYRKVLTKDYMENVEKAAPMHDIGKISTPDVILQKPGKLTDEEYEIMKLHTTNGGEILTKSFGDMGTPEFRKIAYEVALYHHEKWNGRGYPTGLSGENIPLHARIMAVADVFDAISAKRCYRDAMPIDKCFKIIEEGAGQDFDPELVKLFLGAKDKVLELYNKK